MLDDLEEVERAQDVCGVNGGKKKEPMGLMGHLRTQGERCPLHRGIYLYLNNLYGNFWGPGLGHKALYMVNDASYKAAEAANMKTKKRIYDSIREKLEAAEEKALQADKEREAFKAKMKVLDKKIEALESEKNENKIELSDDDIISYGKQFRWFIAAMTFKIQDKKFETPIKINVPNNFEVQDLFDYLYKKDKDNSYLMRELSGLSGVHCHAPKLIKPWNIQYKDVCYKKDRAEADTGPTRAFLSQVWKQMGSLEASKDGIGVELFEETSSGYVPVTNEKLMLAGNIKMNQNVKDSVLSKAKIFYRAIGRLMLHSLITNHPISAIVIPKFYRNVIFRDCNFKDSRYPRSEIIKDLLSIDATILNSLDTCLGSPLNNFIDAEEGEVVTTDNFFTMVIPHMWVHSRSIALDAIKEGMSLDGFVDIQGLFRLMPIEGVSKVAFLKDDTKPEDIVGILYPTYTKGPSTAVENQIDFYENVFKKVIMDKGKNDINFLSNFVSFVTGLGFVPHILTNPLFRIEIEFNPMLGHKALPASKTCQNVLFLPTDCYDMDREEFERKLDESFAQVGMSGFSDI